MLHLNLSLRASVFKDFLNRYKVYHKYLHQINKDITESDIHKFISSYTEHNTKFLPQDIYILKESFNYLLNGHTSFRETNIRHIIILHTVAAIVKNDAGNYKLNDQISYNFNLSSVTPFTYFDNQNHIFAISNKQVENEMAYNRKYKFNQEVYINNAQKIHVYSGTEDEINSFFKTTNITYSIKLESIIINKSEIKSIDFITNFSNTDKITVLDCASLNLNLDLFHSFDHLSTLFIERCQLSSFTLPKMNNLKVLHINSNKIKHLDLINGSHYLQELKVQGNQLAEFDSAEQFIDQNVLNVLWINNNKLKKVDFKKLFHLKTLKCEKNLLTTFDSHHIFSKINNISSLNISKNKITKIDTKNLPLLSELKYEGNPVKEINYQSSYMKDLNLNKIDYSKKKLDVLNYENLIKLELEGCKLAEFNTKKLFKNTNNVEIVNLKNNELTMTDLSQLKELRELDLSENKFTEFQLWKQYGHSNKYAFSILECGLRKLNLADNLLESVDLCPMNTLTELNLSNNQIFDFTEVQLPSSIENLDISENKISQIKSNILVMLYNLTIFNFANNQMEEIHLENGYAFVNDMKKLKEVNISGNKFKKLVEVINYFKTCQKIVIDFDKKSFWNIIKAFQFYSFSQENILHYFEYTADKFTRRLHPMTQAQLNKKEDIPYKLLHKTKLNAKKDEYHFVSKLSQHFYASRQNQKSIRFVLTEDQMRKFAAECDARIDCTEHKSSTQVLLTKKGEAYNVDQPQVQNHHHPNAFGNFGGF